MPRFTVYLTGTVSHVVEVDAATAEEAEEKAYEIDTLPVSMCHQCAREFEFSGEWNVDSVEAAS